MYVDVVKENLIVEILIFAPKWEKLLKGVFYGLK